jgi:SAM-dependent methyltransferase
MEKEEGKEDSWIERQSGEDYFDKAVLEAAKGKDVIDIGCGWAEFTLAVARVATRTVGIDFSQNAISKALKNRKALKAENVEFRLAEARKIPFPDGSFDLGFSRRGPAMESLRSITEAFRVLRTGGRLIQQECGERDKLNWIQVFGRGQDLRLAGKIADEKKKLLAEAGIRSVYIQEFDVTEYFKTLRDVVMRLETTPIIPNFDWNADHELVEKLGKTCADEKGIKTNEHRVIITATKS